MLVLVDTVLDEYPLMYVRETRTYITETTTIGFERGQALPFQIRLNFSGGYKIFTLIDIKTGKDYHWIYRDMEGIFTLKIYEDTPCCRLPWPSNLLTMKQTLQKEQERAEEMASKVTSSSPYTIRWLENVYNSVERGDTDAALEILSDSIEELIEYEEHEEIDRVIRSVDFEKAGLIILASLRTAVRPVQFSLLSYNKFYEKVKLELDKNEK